MMTTMNNTSNSIDKNSLAQLCELTTVVADTGDLSAIAQFKPIDATTNPSLITAAASLPENNALIEAAFAQAQQQGLSGEPLLNQTIDILTVKLGIEILNLIDGRVSTEVDPNFSYNTEATIARALQTIELYEQAGISKERVLIKIAATWEGIQAAKVLEQQGIHCNLTLIFGLAQAAACADANVTLISPFVGRILDWYKAFEKKDSYAIEQDPGVVSVKQIYNYYKQHGISTQVMGASFRSTEQVLALAGCDLLTIAPALLDQLKSSTVKVSPQLSKQLAQSADVMPKLTLDAQRFDAMMNNDQMAFELLQSGVDGFIKAREQLSQRLRKSFGIGDLES